MTRLTPLVRLRVPLGGQEIELQQIDYDDEPAGAEAAAVVGEAPVPPAAARQVVPMRLLRTRIREHSRFTIFDIDPLTAEQWGQALLDWARAQPRG
jgi:hypothetical protein